MSKKTSQNVPSQKSDMTPVDYMVRQFYHRLYAYSVVDKIMGDVAACIPDRWGFTVEEFEAAVKQIRQELMAKIQQ